MLLPVGFKFKCKSFLLQPDMGLHLTARSFLTILRFERDVLSSKNESPDPAGCWGWARCRVGVVGSAVHGFRSSTFLTALVVGATK